MSFLIIQILSLAIYRQSSANLLSIICQSPGNPLAILCQSPVNPLPSPWQSSDDPLAIICQSPGNPQPFSLQSCAKLEHIHRNSRQSPGNPLSITIFWQPTCNRMTILWQWKREWQRNAKNFEIFGEKLFANNAKCLRNNSYFSLETLLVFSKKKYL